MSASLSPSHMRPALPDERGVSLPELVMVVLIFTIVGTMLAVQFDSWQKSSQLTQERSAAMAEGRLAMAQITRSLRAAGATDTAVPALLSAGPYSVSFYQLTDNALAAGSPVITSIQRTPQGVITYQVRKRSGQIVAGPRDVARFVANPTTGSDATPVFRYFSTPDTELPSSVARSDLTAAELAQVAVVQVTLVMDVDPSSVLGRTVFTDSVYLRSRGF